MKKGKKVDVVVEPIKAVRKEIEVTGDARNIYLEEIDGQVVTGQALLKACRACKKIDGLPKLKMKVFNALTGVITLKSGSIPTSAKLEWAKDNPSRSKANLVFGLTAEQVAELNTYKTQGLNG